MRPFFVACATRNVKYCAIAVQCIHVLAQVHGIAPSQLHGTLTALGEATHLGVDIQLKILQVLPTLFQSYGGYMNGELIVLLLQLCAVLQGNTKTAMVVNTASATLQQLVIAIFDRVASEDSAPESEKREPMFEAPITNDDKTTVRPMAFDALMVFGDLCSLTEKQRPRFLRFNTLPETFGLELLESVLTNHATLFPSHPEFAYVLRTQAVPLLLRAFSEKREFAVTLRVTRLLYLLIRRQLAILEVECEVILTMMTHMMDPESNAPEWKRVLCLEVFHGVCSEFSLVMDIYTEYDRNDSRRSIIQQFVGLLAKIVKESPAVLGTGFASTPFVLNKPADTPDEDMVKLGMHVPGVSVKTSTVRVSYVDLLDKTEPPVAPPSYFFYLTLMCISSLGEGLVKAGTTNQIDTHKSLVQDTWMDFYTICETYFHSTLDLELYRVLVKTAQRYGQICGMLHQIAARDSFLALLAEFAVKGDTEREQDHRGSVSGGSVKNILSAAETLVGSFVDGRGSVSGTSSPAKGTTSAGITDRARGLSARNILCCRAVFTLGQSLGHLLMSKWHIIFELLRAVDTLVHGSPGKRRHEVSGAHMFANLSSDYKVLDDGLQKMLQHTKEYEIDSFLEIIRALCTVSTGKSQTAEEYVPVPSLTTGEMSELVLISLLDDLCRYNIHRLVRNDTWNLVAGFLIGFSASDSNSAEAKIKAASVLDQLILLLLAEKSAAADGTVQRRSFETLQKIIHEATRPEGTAEGDWRSSSSPETMVHVLALENINAIIDQLGAKIIDGWDVVFDIIDSVFGPLKNKQAREKSDSLVRLLRSSFSSLQLICTDFLEALPNASLLSLIDVLYRFSIQTYDINISFTSISFYWRIADYIRSLDTASSKALSDTSADVEQLEKDASDGNVRALWLVCLLRLSAVCAEPRAQVRNGAAPGLFRIMEAHGPSLSTDIWKACQRTVFPAVMSIHTPAGIEGDQVREWRETASLNVGGFSNIYHLFMNKFLKQDDFTDLWHTLIEYYTSLLEHEGLPLRQSVYVGLETILTGVCAASLQLPKSSVDQVWNFWLSQRVPQECDDVKIVQDSLASLVKVHQPLVALNKELSETYSVQSLEVLKDVVSFPLMPQFYSDKDHMTPSQEAALEDISTVDVAPSQSRATVNKLFDVFAHTIRLPYESRSVQSADTHAKPASFVSLNNHTLLLMQQKLSQIESFDIFTNDTLEHVYGSLLLPVSRKFDCPYLSGLESQLWQLATNVFIDLAQKHLPLIADKSKQGDRFEQQEIIELIARCGAAIIESRGDSDLEYTEKYEDFDIDSYKKFIEIFENATKGVNTVDGEVWLTIVSALFRNSFMYSRGDFSREFTVSKENLDMLMSLPFHGSTETPKLASRTKMAYLCLDELFRLAAVDKTDDSAGKVKKIAQMHLLVRLALVLRQFVADSPIRGRIPLPAVQRQELLYVLDKLRDSAARPQAKVLHSLVSGSISVAGNDDKVLAMIQGLLIAE